MEKFEQRRMWIRSAVLGVLVVAGTGVNSAQAVTYYWDNNGATAGFGTAAGTWAAPTTGDATQGWSTSAAGTALPSNITTTTADSANFGTATVALAAGTINVSGTVNIANLTFGALAESLSLSGGTLNIGAGGNSNAIINSSGKTQTIGSAITLSNGDRQIVGSLSATTIFNGNINYGTGRLFPTSTAHKVILNGGGTGAGTAAGSFGLTSAGAASGSTMRTNVAGTVVELGNATALGTGWVQINNDSTLQTNTSLTGVNAVANTFGSGGGNLTIGGSNNIELSGTAGTQFTGVSNAGAFINLGGNRTLTINNTGTTTISGKVSLSDAAATGRILTLNVASAATISGSIVNYVGDTGGTAGSIVKSGNGVLTVSGTNTYNGTTTVSAGKLLVNGTHNQGTGANAGRYTVAGTATLGGSGTITLSDTSGTLTGISVNGTLAPGASIGTLTLDGANSVRSVLAIESGAKLSYEIGGSQSDSIALTGGQANDIFFNNTVIDFAILSPLTVGSYVLFSSNVANAYSGLTLSGNTIISGLTIGTVTGGTLTSPTLRVEGNDIVLAVPEPTSLALFGLAGVTLLRRRSPKSA